MVQPIDDGGPAFPRSTPHQLGMTLRDYFAGQAIIGLIINPATVNPDAPLTPRSYEIADAMLEAGKKPPAKI